MIFSIFFSMTTWFAAKCLLLKAQLPWLGLQLRQHVLFPPDKPEDPSSINTP
jgi:hypothetical protein